MANTPQRTANINAKKFKDLMKDFENDVGRRTLNAKDTDDWLNRLGMYVQNNAFTTGGLNMMR